MAGKHAKTATKQQLTAALRRAANGRYPDRDRVMILLSAKAGLRVGEIAKLTWPMVVDAQGRITRHIELHDAAAKKRSGRTIPLHPDLIRPLRQLQKQAGAHGCVIRSERGGALRPGSVVNWFARLYRELGFEGCTSHSGRRTFITAPLGSCSKPEVACAMSSNWPATGRSSTRKPISRVTRAPNAGSSTCYRAPAPYNRPG